MEWLTGRIPFSNKDIYNSFLGLYFVQLFSHVVFADDLSPVDGPYYRLCGTDISLGLQSLCGSRYADRRTKKDTGVLEGPSVIMNSFKQKRQNNFGIVEMCCYNQFGCSIEALSSFCADDFVQRDAFLNAYGHLQVVVAERQGETVTISPMTATVSTTHGRPTIAVLRGRPSHRNPGRSHVIRPFLSPTRRPHDFAHSLSNLRKWHFHRP